MGWLENKLDYAGDRLEKAVGHAADKLNAVVQQGIAEAGSELRDVVLQTSREVDSKLDKISEELSSQRHFTKSDIKELVDYAADRMGATMDERIRIMRAEITDLVQDKVEYLKAEVDQFFIQRQQDLARERRRLIANVGIAVAASIAVAVVSYMYQRAGAGATDVFGLFRILFLSLTGGYAVYLAVNLALKYSRMAEHRKDLLFVAARYWGVLRPQSVLGHLLVLLAIALIYAAMLVPDTLASITGTESLLRWLRNIGTSR